jgi:uncharacterized protein YdhG (YjbR/CyaY superfamily)
MRKNKFHTINEYINTFPKDVQIILDKISQTIRKAAPEATEAISYGIPHVQIKRQTVSVFCRLEKSYRILSNAIGRKSIQTRVVSV